MSGRASRRSAAVMRVVTWMGGFAVICVETLRGREPRWELLVTAAVMMGLVSVDQLDKILPWARRPRLDDDERNPDDR